MADWNGDYLSPYAEHGKKSEQVKKLLFLFQQRYFKSLLTSVLVAK